MAVGALEPEGAAHMRGYPTEARRQPSHQERALRTKARSFFGGLLDRDLGDFARQIPHLGLVEETGAELLPKRNPRPRQVGQVRARAIFAGPARKIEDAR